MKFVFAALALVSVEAITTQRHLTHYARPVSYAQHAHNVKSRDAYDYDPETTSPYDDMEQHMKWDFGVPRGAPGSKSPFGEHHGSWVDMSWRNQANYGVAYDESVNKYPNEKL